MTKYCGRDLLLQIEEPAASGTYVSISALRDTTISLSSEPIDVTDRSSGSDTQLLSEAGTRSVSVTGGGQFSDETVIATLEEAARNGKVINARVLSGHNDNYTGPFYVTTFERTGSYNGVEEYTISLQSSATITYTP